MIFAFLGDQIQMGVSNVMEGPTASDETLDNTLHEHKVLRGKPIPQEGGEELDKQNFSFFFDESFCDPQAQYYLLRQARSSRSVMPLVFGNGAYIGKHYWVKSVKITHQKTTETGRLVRIDAKISLIEVPRGALSIGISGIASIGRALINPLVKRN